MQGFWFLDESGASEGVSVVFDCEVSGISALGWMRFAGRKLSDESLMFGSPSVGKSLIHIDESSFE